MSLMDGLLLDALLETVVRSDVWFAIRRDNAVGRGTRDDPFDGSTAERFDAAMNDVPTNTTIHLGPTAPGFEFRTRGSAVWRAKHGQRIVGAGMDATTLKVDVDTTSEIDIVAIGHSVDKFDSTPIGFLLGFEVSDLTIDCSNFESFGDSSALGGISLTGRGIYIRRVRVLGFGNRREGAFAALSAAWACTALEAPTDCVIEECEVLTPYSEVDAETMVAFRMGSAGSGSPLHVGCVIRNCYADFEDASFVEDFCGIVASGGVGTIIEGNQIRNCKWGGPYQDGEAISTQDMVVRDNTYTKVKNGISLTLPNGSTAGWIVVQNNWMDLADASGVVGIRLNRATAGGFTNVLLRGNVVKYETIPDPIPATDYGIHLTGCANAIVENNVIDVGTADQALWHTNCNAVKPFNNQTSEGGFRPGYNDATQRHDAELTTDVEYVLLGL